MTMDYITQEHVRLFHGCVHICNISRPIGKWTLLGLIYQTIGIILLVLVLCSTMGSMNDPMGMMNV